MNADDSPWDRYRLIETCLRLQFQQERVKWGIFVEADCLQTMEAYLGIWDVIHSNRIQEDAAGVLLEGEMAPFLALDQADSLFRLGPVDLDGPLPVTLAYMNSEAWHRIIHVCQKLLNVMLQNGVPGLVAWWASVPETSTESSNGEAT